MASEYKADIKKVKRIVRRPPANQIPNEIRNDAALNAQIAASLPSNYNFEIHKIVHRVRQLNCKRVCLQFPEGLLLFSTPIANIVRSFAACQVIVLADVTYGACCIDDYVARLNGCDFVIHFAHSCLIPLNELLPDVKALYVFVDIKFDILHCLQTFMHNFPLREQKADSTELFTSNAATNQTNIYKASAANACASSISTVITAGSEAEQQQLQTGRIAIASSIQFVSSVHFLQKELSAAGYNVLVPQAKPLSPGEVLGCTAPKLPDDVRMVLFVCDGRFHLEAIMIANPQVQAFYKYNPYDKQITREHYDQPQMLRNRQEAMRQARTLLDANSGQDVTIGLILGTLGHQGNPKILHNLRERIRKTHPQARLLNVMVPEISAAILDSFGESVQIWVQISCPRLSIDWATDVIRKPLLTPFELNWALKETQQAHHIVDPITDYPMDFYASNSLGNWTPNHKCNSQCSC